MLLISQDGGVFHLRGCNYAHAYGTLVKGFPITDWIILAGCMTLLRHPTFEEWKRAHARNLNHVTRYV